MNKFILIISIFLVACNPVKSVLKDPIKFNQVKDIVIRGGYCINDTVTIETKKDSIIFKDSVTTNTISVPCKDFDSTFKDGTSIRVSSGVLTYKQNYSTKEIIRTVIKTNNIRDLSLEAILKSDISKKDDTIRFNALVISETKKSLKESKAANTKLKWEIFGVIALLAVWKFRFTILKLVNL